jgi:3-phenylpropionate/trans-cinnamate dioxygenase ferredoxin reductase component
VTDSVDSAGVVIIGAGQAGGDLTGYLRQQGHHGRIVMVGDEPYMPYRRPPLSKTFLSGEVTLESLYLKSAESYARQEVICRLGVGAESIDRRARQVRLFDGSVIGYEHLVLATGGRARRLALPGADLPNVHCVRSIADILKLKEQFLPGRRLLIVGGGFIGLEAASVGIKKGLAVTVIEALPRLLARVTAPEMSSFYENAHRARGVEIRLGAGVQAFEGQQFVDTVVLSTGERLATDLVVVGVGQIPNTELGEAAGLAVNNGIVVDVHTQTADPQVFAIGDCSNHENAFLGRRLRLESVPNAVEQARVCAAAICGKPVPYDAVPWFWSDQYDLKLQMVGLSQGYDRMVLRGDMAKESFCAFYLKDGIVIAADAVNRPAEFMAAKKLVAARVAPAPERLIDEAIPIKNLLTNHRSSGEKDGGALL